MFNRLFQFGAHAVVDVPRGIVRSRGGAATLALKGAGSYQHFEYVRSDAGGRYSLYGIDKQDADGWFGSERTNYWNNGHQDNRGFDSTDIGGIVVETLAPPSPSDHIRNVGLGAVMRLVNPSAFAGYAGQAAAVSNTLSMVLSFWVRRPDKGTVNASTCVVFMADSTDWYDAGGNKAGATQYEKHANGWYRVWAVVPPRADTNNRAQGLAVNGGVTLYVDLPQHERFSSSTPGPTEPIYTDSTADRARVQHVLECFLRGAAGHGPHLQAGAIAIACSPERSAAEHTFGQLLLYGDTDTNHGFILSDSEDRFSGWTRIATVTESFINAGDPGAFARHTPIGACYQWGMNGPGTGDYFLAAQGVRGGRVTAEFDLPALAAARLLVGGRLDGSDVASSAANARILLVAFFPRRPGPQACMKISRYMQEQAKAYWRWQ